MRPLGWICCLTLLPPATAGELTTDQQELLGLMSPAAARDCLALVAWVPEGRAEIERLEQQVEEAAGEAKAEAARKLTAALRRVHQQIGTKLPAWLRSRLPQLDALQRRLASAGEDASAAL